MTLGFPWENNPDDYTFLIELILIGTLLNSSSFFTSSSSSSPLEKASANIGWLEFLEGCGILKICFGHCPN